MGATIRNRLITLFFPFLCAVATSCTDTPTYAPVYDIANIEPMISKLAAPSPQEMPAQSIVSTWRSPVAPQYVHKYVLVNKGVDILGRQGEPIMATAKGKVVFAGAGLRGYGNLIIIKHNNDYLSVYAHTEDPLVKPGDWVKAGQIVASMGNTGTRQIKLHFEIRRLGKPLNPLILLRQKSV